MILPNRARRASTRSCKSLAVIRAIGRRAASWWWGRMMRIRAQRGCRGGVRRQGVIPRGEWGQCGGSRSSGRRMTRVGRCRMKPRAGNLRADKAYRLGVFHLESLRLRRDKLQTSAVRVSSSHFVDGPSLDQNLETFNDDLNKTLMNALEVYMDTMHGTAATVAQATQVPRRVIEEVNLDKDSELRHDPSVDRNLTRSVALPHQNEGRRFGAHCACAVSQLLRQLVFAKRCASLTCRWASVDHSSSV